MVNINEIFYSVQGEGTRVGMPCVFVRLQGCKLRCTWCDTPYALDSRVRGMELDHNELIAKIQEYQCSFVEFTGGEPLEQPAILPVMQTLCDLGYTVAVETAGHVDVSNVDGRVVKILDVKCPDSRMSTLNRWENFNYLQAHDEVKFVIASRADFEWAADVVLRHGLADRVTAVLFSPAFGMLEYVDLVNWILADKVPVRFQAQIHKHIWAPDTRGV